MTAQRLRFTVFGEPVTKGRPRFTNRGGFVRTFTDPRTRAAEENIRSVIAPLVPPDWPLDARYHANLKVYTSTRVRADLDNYVKLCWDSLNEVLYDDDTQLWEISASRYVDKARPRIVISIKVIEPR